MRNCGMELIAPKLPLAPDRPSTRTKSGHWGTDVTILSKLPVGVSNFIGLISNKLQSLFSLRTHDAYLVVPRGNSCSKDLIFLANIEATMADQVGW